MTLYVDTSALAKWYIDEIGSREFDIFIRSRFNAHISRLTIVEFQCALARRGRNRDISAAIERSALKLFESHLKAGLLSVLPVEDAHFIAAVGILRDLPTLPLRTLDSLHLAIARATRMKSLATADHVMAAAARALKFETHTFG